MDKSKKILNGNRIIMHYPDILEKTKAQSLLKREERNLRKSEELLNLAYKGKVNLYIYEFPFNKNWTDLKGVHYAIPSEHFKALSDLNNKVLGEIHEWIHFLCIKLLCPVMELDSPTFFLAEGLAVAIDSLLNKDYEKHLNLVVKGLRDKNRLKSITEVSPKDLVSYTHYLTGCITLYLLKKYGIEKIKSVYKYIDDPQEFFNVFKQIYGIGLKELENEWLDYLDETYHFEGKRARYIANASLKLDDYHPFFLKYEKNWTLHGFNDLPSNILKIEEDLYKAYFDLSTCSNSELEYYNEQYNEAFKKFKTVLDKRDKCIQEFAKAQNLIEKSNNYDLMLEQLGKANILALEIKDSCITNRIHKHIDVIKLIKEASNTEGVQNKKKKYKLAQTIIDDSNYKGEEYHGRKI